MLKSYQNRSLAVLMHVLIAASLAVSALLAFLQPVKAAAVLTIEPITWNIIGLDSNNVNTGPENFPVGVRVCNTGDAPAINVTSTFVWDTTNTFINLRPGSLSSFSGANAVASLGVGDCHDFYYEVQVTRNASAYDTTRRYHITATADTLGTVSTPQPRELYVEHLISQNRNAINNVELDGLSIPPGGSMNLVVGQTYQIKLYGGTATQGYNNFEQFINFPNTIFQINSVSTTYSANNSPYVGNPDDKLYADACLWQNDLNSPNYRECVGGDYKAGGSNVVTTYSITILSGGGTSQSLNTLLYDFSGSSYHYNADFSTGARIATIIDPTNVSISKSFSPNPTNINGISALTITITNPNAGTVSGYNFNDPLPSSPAQMMVANPASATTSGCGSPTFNPSPGAFSLSFSGGSIAANSNCVVKVNVTTSATGNFLNTTDNLFVGATDTGESASDTLVVNSAPPAGSGLCGLTMAQWTFAVSPAFPAPFTTAPDVATAALTAGNGAIIAADSGEGNPLPSMDAYGWPSNATINHTTNPYIQFQIDTSNYTGVEWLFDINSKQDNPGPDNAAVYYSTDGTTWAQKGANFALTASFAAQSFDFTGQTNTGGTTYFRLYGLDATNANQGADLNLDNVLFSGCGDAQPATINKAFSPNPIQVNGVSTLTFTLTNPNASALSGATFTDTLPSGVEVAATPNASTTCTGAPTWSPTAAATSLTFGTPTGANIPASGFCTVSVDVAATTAGPHSNTSGFLATAEGGTNTESVGSATLTAISPPTIEKIFSPNPIIANAVTTLTFTIENPNLNDGISGVAFTDNFPAGVVVAGVPAASASNCGSPTWVPVAAAASVTFSGGTIAAGGTCIVTVDVTPNSTGNFINTTSAVTHIVNAIAVGADTASDTLEVDPPNPGITLLKQVSNSLLGPWSSFLAVSENGDVYYRFVVENTGDVPLSPIFITDNTLDVSSCNTNWSASTLPVADANDDDHIAICTLLTPVSAVAGTHINTASATGTYSGSPYTSENSSATYATASLSIDKSVAESYFTQATDVLNYSFLVENTGDAILDGPVTIDDDKANDESCPSLSTIGDNDNFFDPGEQITCTATYTVLAADVTAGEVENIASATSGVATSGTDTEVVPLAPDLTADKVNDVSGVVPLGDSFIWTITLTNSAGAGSASFADTQVILTDELPTSGATYVLGTVSTTGTVTGTVDCSITTNVLTCSADGAVSIGADSTIVIPITVTPNVLGSLVNPRSPSGVCEVDPDDVQQEINDTNNDCGPDTVVVIDINAEDDTGNSVDSTAGGTSVPNILVNDILAGAQATTSNVDITVVGVLPAGINLNLATGEVTVAPGTTPGTYFFDYQICDKNDATLCDTATVTVPVVFSAVPNMEIVKAFDLTSAQNGDTVTVTITVENTGNEVLDSTQVTDDLTTNFGAAGVDYTIANRAASFTTGTGTATVNGSYDGDSDQDLLTTVSDFDPAEVIEISFDLTFVSVLPGDFTNTASGSATGAISEDPASDDSTDDIQIVGPQLTVTKSFSPTTAVNGDTITITITIENTGTEAITDLQVTDDLAVNFGTAGVDYTVASHAASFTTDPGADGSVSVNTAFDGDTDQDLFTTVSGFDPGDVVEGSFEITLVSVLGGTYTNVASASGTGALSEEDATAVGDDDFDLNESGLAVTKDFSAASATVGETVTVIITLENAGIDELTAVQVTDDLTTNFGVAGTDYTIANRAASFTTGAGTATVNASFDGDADQDLLSAVSGFENGEVITITFEITFVNVVVDSYTNTADAVATGASTATNLNEQAAADIDLTLDIALTKTLLTASDELSNTTDPDVAIGEILTYQLQLTLGPDLTIPNAALNDILDLGLAFYDCVSVTADAGIATDLAANLAGICDRTADFPPASNGANPTVSEEPAASVAAEDQGRNLSFDLGTLQNTDSINNQTLTIIYRVIVLDTAANVRGVSLNNEAAWKTGSPASSATEVTIVEPDLGITKTADLATATAGDEITFTITIFHTPQSDSDAFDVVMADDLPPELLYVTNSLAWVSGPLPDVLDQSNPTSLSVTWNTLPDNNTPTVVEFRALVGNFSPGASITNSATVAWSSFPLAIQDRTDPVSPFNTFSTERFYDPGDPVNIYGGIEDSVTIALLGSASGPGRGNNALDLPDVGFAPHQVTALPEQPAEKAYAALGDLWLEIPRLGVQTAIVGVPLAPGGWDLTWLADQAGYLNGTAFPTWPGNTVLTGHVIDANGQSGPFEHLASLRYGDTVIIHAFGQSYVYEIRTNRTVRPDDLSVLAHEQLDWLTLLTCRDYDPLTGSYLERTVVKAVLIDIY